MKFAMNTSPCGGATPRTLNTLALWSTLTSLVERHAPLLMSFWSSVRMSLTTLPARGGVDFLLYGVF